MHFIDIARCFIKRLTCFDIDVPYLFLQFSKSATIFTHLGICESFESRNGIRSTRLNLDQYVFDVQWVPTFSNDVCEITLLRFLFRRLQFQILKESDHGLR